MTSENESAGEANPYNLGEGDQAMGSGGAETVVTLWMLPAVLIVIVMWILITVPGKLYPLTIIHFVSLQLGPIVSAVAVAIWWLMSKRVPRRQRWVGLLLLVATFFATMFASHDSMFIPMLVWGIPVVLTLLVGAFWLTGSVDWDKRRWLAYGAPTLFLLTSLFFRIGSIDAAFAFSVVPRWQPTAEEKYLADLRESGDVENSVETVAVLPDQVSGRDWAEFRGPDRDGVLRGVSIVSDWTNDPPPELWRRKVGPGWSSFCVVGPLAITQEQRGEQETVVAYAVEDGRQRWATSVTARFSASMGGTGPRATPTYASGKLFITGGTGVVQCLDASTGESEWEYDLVEELQVSVPQWGFSSSPLVRDDLVIVFAGGGDNKGVVALDRKTGKFRWSGSDGYHGYSSPQWSTLAGRGQVVISSNLGLRGLSLEDGEVLWKHDWDIGQMARVTQPLVIGDAVYMGTGYGNGTMRVDVSEAEGTWRTEEKWVAQLKPYFNDFVHYQGHLYGFDDKIFTCIDAETGEKNWKRGRYGYGQVLLVEDDGLLLVISEKGELVLLEANPARHREIASIKAIDGVTWNHPVIADGKLFVRNGEEAVCYELQMNEEKTQTPSGERNDSSDAGTTTERSPE